MAPPAPSLLMLTSNLPRWSGDTTTPFVLHLATDLTGLGWQVTILAPHADGAERQETVGPVRVLRFPYALRPARQRVAYGGGALFNIRRSPRAALQVPTLVAAEWWAARRQLCSGAYDVVQSHWLVPQGTVAAAAAGGVPHLATVHGSDVLGLDAPPVRLVKRWTLQRVDAVSANSAATEAAVRRLAPAGLPVHRIPMGITLVPPATERGQGEPPTIGYVGRLVGWKGVEDLLTAVALLRSGLAPTLRCRVAGTGREAAALTALASRLGIAAAVDFVGWVDPADVPAELDALDVAVFPSRLEADGTTEGQGLSILEAMARGRPVVATRVGGIPDSIDDGVHGLLVDERSPQQLADAVGRLLADPGAARRLGLAARERAVRDFSRASSARRFDEVLRGLLR